MSTKLSITRITGIVLLSLAICSGLLLGSLGWFMVGFGTMTSCTNAYNCSETGCPPCVSAEHWLNGGAFVQFLVVCAAVTLLCVGVVQRWRAALALSGAGLLALSAVAIVATTALAEASY